MRLINDKVEDLRINVFKGIFFILLRNIEYRKGLK